MKKFIAYLTFGYPDLNTSLFYIKKFSEIGVDIIEIGFPYSDPLADGKTIQEASSSSLKKREYSINEFLHYIKSLKLKIPVVILTYYNPVFNFGIDRFLKLSKDSNVWGVLIPDLLFEEGIYFRKKCFKYGIKNIELISPLTPLERIRIIADQTKGFLYYVSVTGVTGARKGLPSGIIGKLKRISEVKGDIPLYAGFGFSNKIQISKIIEYVDGIIIGSAIVEKLNKEKDCLNYVEDIAKFIHKF